MFSAGSLLPIRAVKETNPSVYALKSLIVDPPLGVEVPQVE